MMKPSRTFCLIYSLINTIILDRNADAWGPWAMDISRAFYGQAGTAWTGMPYILYYYKAFVAECQNTLGSAARYPHCQYTMKDVREGACSGPAVIILAAEASLFKR